MSPHGRRSNMADVFLEVARAFEFSAVLDAIDINLGRKNDAFSLSLWLWFLFVSSASAYSRMERLGAAWYGAKPFFRSLALAADRRSCISCPF